MSSPQMLLKDAPTPTPTYSHRFWMNLLGDKYDRSELGAGSPVAMPTAQVTVIFALMSISLVSVLKQTGLFGRLALGNLLEFIYANYRFLVIHGNIWFGVVPGDSYGVLWALKLYLNIRSYIRR